MKPDLSIEYLRECLSYDPETGICTWNLRPLSHFESHHRWALWNSTFSGKKAGSTIRRKSLTYAVLNLRYKNWAIHRLAWAITTGVWPEQIDHIDGNGLNNRLVNLRSVTTHENMKNKKKYGCRELPTGVYRYGNGKRFCAKIQTGGKLLHLGTFDTLQEAVKIRKDSEAKFGFSDRHGLA